MTPTLPSNDSNKDLPRVNLALQGGGSHGAFTWGVLDALLEDGRVALEGISGTSAGAMNAVALAHGFAQAHDKVKVDPREAAREALADFWNGIVQMGALSEAQRAPFEVLFGRIGGDSSSTAEWANAMTSFWSGAVSPYQSNPFDINPLRKFLEGRIDFEGLARLQTLKVFVVATRVSICAPAIHGKVGLRASITGEIVTDGVFCTEENAFTEVQGLKGPFNTCEGTHEIHALILGRVQTGIATFGNL